MTHIDDWITNPIHRNEGEKYAKFVLTYFRYPAWAKGDFRQWMGQFKLFCTYQGKRYRVTGASRMGDVWLAEDLNRESGYDLRVDVAECCEWGEAK